VTAYVIDTGILITHNEFGGRATSGYNAIAGESGSDLNGMDVCRPYAPRMCFHAHCRRACAFMPMAAARVLSCAWPPRMCFHAHGRRACAFMRMAAARVLHSCVWPPRVWFMHIAAARVLHSCVCPAWLHSCLCAARVLCMCVMGEIDLSNSSHTK